LLRGRLSTPLGGLLPISLRGRRPISLRGLFLVSLEVGSQYRWGRRFLVSLGDLLPTPLGGLLLISLGASPAGDSSVWVSMSRTPPPGPGPTPAPGSACAPGTASGPAPPALESGLVCLVRWSAIDGRFTGSVALVELSRRGRPCTRKGTTGLKVPCAPK